MDCQLIMGAFVYFYHQTFIKIVTVGTSAYILSLLTPNEQLNLFNALRDNLAALNLVWFNHQSFKEIRIHFNNIKFKIWFDLIISIGLKLKEKWLLIYYSYWKWIKRCIDYWNIDH